MNANVSNFSSEDKRRVDLTFNIDGGADMVAALDKACAAAEEGVEFTKTIRATKGRASYLGDRSIGHQDPGATSATLTLEAIRDFLKA